VDDLGARPGERLIGVVQAVGCGAGLAGGGVQQVAVLQSRAPGAEQVRAHQPRLGGQRAGGGHPLAHGVQRGDGRGEPLGERKRLGGVGLAQAGPRLDGDQPDLGQGRGQTRLGDLAGVAEGHLGGGVQPWIAEDLSAQQRTEGLFAARARPAVGSASRLEAGGGGLCDGGGLAQRHGVAGAPGDLAPDHRGFKPEPRWVLRPDPARRDVGRLGLLGQQAAVEEFQQRGVATRQAVDRRLRPLGGEETLQFAAQLEHQPAPSPPRVPPWNAPLGAFGMKQSPSRAA
jgi:hypothetical protein